MTCGWRSPSATPARFAWAPSSAGKASANNARRRRGRNSTSAWNWCAERNKKPRPGGRGSRLLIPLLFPLRVGRIGRLFEDHDQFHLHLLFGRRLVGGVLRSVLGGRIFLCLF